MRKIFRMPVPLDDLGGNGRGFEFQTLADPGLHLRGQVGEGAHRAGDLAHRDGLPGRGQAGPLPLKLGVPQGELQAQGDGLGVHPVGPAHHEPGP